jgi:photosystem II stability/assembly factor-like uncharacterized protein
MMQNKGSTVLILLLGFSVLAIFTPASSRAGENQWTNIGLEGEDVNVLVIAPVTPTAIYAGTDNGLYKTTDGGGHWTAINNGLPGPEISVLAVNPSDPTILYAGNLFKSTDSGANWVSIYNNLIGKVLSLATDPNNPQTLYVGTDFGGLSKSEDDGDSWTPVLATTGISALAVDYNSPDIVYAGGVTSYGDPGGMYKTTGGGDNWASINNGLADPNTICLTMDPSAPATLYVCAGGNFKTVDGGANWVSKNKGLLNTNTRSIAIDYSNPSVIYKGDSSGQVQRSRDGGDNWDVPPMTIELDQGSINALVLDPDDPNVLYAGKDGGVYHYRVSPESGGGSGGGGG